MVRTLEVRWSIETETRIRYTALSPGADAMPSGNRSPFHARCFSHRLRIYDCPDQCRNYRESRPGLVEPEIPLQSPGCSRNDGRIKAEQKSAQRRRDRETQHLFLARCNRILVLFKGVRSFGCSLRIPGSDFAILMSVSRASQVPRSRVLMRPAEI